MNIRKVSLGSQNIHRRTLALPLCERVVRTLKPKSGYPKQLNTLGDRLRAYRIDREATKQEMASRIGITPQTLRNWERNRTKAEVRYYPKILSLIGIVTHDRTLTFGANCRAMRRKLGLSAKRLAVLAGVDEATVRRLEADTPRMARCSISKISGALRIPDPLR